MSHPESKKSDRPGQQLDQQALMVGQLDFSIISGFLGFAMPPLGETGEG